MRFRPSHRLLSVIATALLLPTAALSVEWHARQREVRGAFLLVGEPQGLGWLPRPDHGDHNRWGFRDDAWPERPIPGIHRVVVVGDGATYGGEVAPEHTWVAHSEAALRAEGHAVELLNMGVIGYDLTQVQALLRHVAWEFDPELVVWAWSPNDDLPSEAFELGAPPYPVALLASPRLEGGVLGWLAPLRPLSAWYRRAEGKVLAETERLSTGHGSPRARAERFEQAWQALLEDVHAHDLPLVVLVVPTPPAARGEPIATARHRDMLTKAGSQAVVVDGLAALERAGDARQGHFDGLHPNAIGHEALGDAVATGLAPLLRAPEASGD